MVCAELKRCGVNLLNGLTDRLWDVAPPPLVRYSLTTRLSPTRLDDSTPYFGREKNHATSYRPDMTVPRRFDKDYHSACWVRVD